MKLEDIIKDSARDWQRFSPAQPESLRALKDAYQIELPTDYLAFLSQTDGGEGELPVQPFWFQIWPSDKVVEYNKGYEVKDNLPGFFGFGSSGGGELLAFDTRQGKPWKIVAVPFIPMEAEEAILVGEDFLSFARLMGRNAETVN
jgi:hypothetical protein